MGWPLTSMVPRSIFSRWLRQRRNVDLPPPEGPMITTTSPRLTSRLTPLSTSALWKRLQTSTARTIGASLVPSAPLMVSVPTAGHVTGPAKAHEHPPREPRLEGQVLAFAEALLDSGLDLGQEGRDQQVPD